MRNPDPENSTTAPVRRRKIKHTQQSRRFVLETEVSWFVLVSILDLVTTFLVLRYSGEGRLRVNVVESNPIAQWFLLQAGLPGMAVFKVVMIAVVVGIAVGIERRRPVVSRLLLWGGTLVVASVVIWSTRLILQNQ